TRAPPWNRAVFGAPVLAPQTLAGVIGEQAQALVARSAHAVPTLGHAAAAEDALDSVAPGKLLADVNVPVANPEIEVPRHLRSAAWGRSGRRRLRYRRREHEGNHCPDAGCVDGR